MNAQAQKIVLKSTTKISLNDRFSALRKEPTVANIRQRIQLMRQASARNRRLAQQMENRPSVIAALKLKKRSLMQRLGKAQRGSVKARLSLGGSNRGFRGTFNLRNNRGGRYSQPRGVLRQRNFIQKRNRGSRNDGFVGRGSLRSGTSPLIKARLGGQNVPRGNIRGNLHIMRGNRRSFGGRGNIGSRGAYQGLSPRFQQRGERGIRGRGTRNRGGRGRGRQLTPTKQELDYQLDEYMAKTKSHLDAELDAYMSQATE